MTRRQLDYDPHRDSGAYVLNALTGREHARYRRHMRRCRSCVEEVAGFRRTIVLLTGDLSETPPDRLRERLLDSTTKHRSVREFLRQDQSRRA